MTKNKKRTAFCPDDGHPLQNTVQFFPVPGAARPGGYIDLVAERVAAELVPIVPIVPHVALVPATVHAVTVQIPIVAPPIVLVPLQVMRIAPQFALVAADFPFPPRRNVAAQFGPILYHVATISADVARVAVDIPFVTNDFAMIVAHVTLVSSQIARIVPCPRGNIREWDGRRRLSACGASQGDERYRDGGRFQRCVHDQGPRSKTLGEGFRHLHDQR